MKLAKALKTKNQLVAKLKNAYQHLAKENSVATTTKRAYDPINLMDDIQGLTKKLIELKVKIAAANTNVMPIIIEMSELKSSISGWKNIDCTNGESVDRFSRGTSQTIYASIFSQVEIDKKVSETEDVIQSLQDKLDEYNHGVEINFTL